MTDVVSYLKKIIDPQKKSKPQPQNLNEIYEIESSYKRLIVILRNNGQSIQRPIVEKLRKQLLKIEKIIAEKQSKDDEPLEEQLKNLKEEGKWFLKEWGEAFETLGKTLEKKLGLLQSQLDGTLTNLQEINEQLLDIKKHAFSAEDPKPQLLQKQREELQKKVSTLREEVQTVTKEICDMQNIIHPEPEQTIIEPTAPRLMQ